MTTMLPVEETTRAVDLCAELDLSDEGQALLRPEDTAEAFFARLLEAEELFDAIRVMARALPKATAVEWACACARASIAGEPDEPAKQSLDAAEQWLMEPTEEHRGGAQAAAEA
ncbi:MAG: DUF6931 family protein, partial [Planctomycetota bacterium]